MLNLRKSGSYFVDLINLISTQTWIRLFQVVCSFALFSAGPCTACALALASFLCLSTPKAKPTLLSLPYKPSGSYLSNLTTIRLHPSLHRSSFSPPQPHTLSLSARSDSTSTSCSLLARFGSNTNQLKSNRKASGGLG